MTVLTEAAYKGVNASSVNEQAVQWYQRALPVVESVTSHAKDLGQVLREKKIASRKNMTLLLCTAAILLAGCSAINTSDISKYNGAISGIDADRVAISAQYSDSFYYESALQQMVQQARALGYDQGQIEQEINNLKYTYPFEVRMSASGNGAGAFIEQLAPSPEDQQAMRTPYRLTLNPQADGVYSVEIRAQECIKGTNTCTPQTGFVLNVTYDGTGPSVGLNPISKATDGSGIIVSGRASDMSGVSGASVNACDNSASFQPVLDGAGNFSAVVAPRPGTNCWYVSAYDAFGNSGASGSEQFEYRMDVSGQMAPTASGKLQAAGKGGTNLGNPVQVRFRTCDSQVEIPSSPQGDTTVSQEFSPKPGNNCVLPVLTDAWGNMATGPAMEYGYQVDLTGNAVSTGSGKIEVAGRAATNLKPIVSVSISDCFGAANPVPAVLQPDGQFKAEMNPAMGDNCLIARAVDQEGNVVNGPEMHTDYGFDPGAVTQKLVTEKGKTTLFLMGNPPDNVNPLTAQAQGTQPKWKMLGAEGTFSCANLGEGLMDGKLWKYVLSCDLPSNAGDAKLRFNIRDVNGYELTVYYPLSSSLVADLRDAPTTGEAALYFGPIIAGIFAALTASGVLANYAVRSAKRGLAIMDTNTLLVPAAEFLRKSEHGLTPQAIEDAYQRIDAAQKYVDAVKTKDRKFVRTLQKRIDMVKIPVVMRKIEWIAGNAALEMTDDSFGDASMLHEAASLYMNHAAEVNVKERREVVGAVAKKLQLLLSRMESSRVNAPSWGAWFNAQRFQTNALIQALYELHANPYYAGLWGEIKKINPGVAKSCTETALCFAASRNLLAKGKVQRYFIGTNGHENPVASKADIAYVLCGRNMGSEARSYILGLKTERERTEAVEGVIRAGDLQNAAIILSAYGNNDNIKQETELKLAVAIAEQVAEQVYAGLPSNRKLHPDLNVREVKRILSKQPEMLPYLSMVVDQVVRLNARMYTKGTDVLN